MKKLMVIMLFLPSLLWAHPDGTTPYWYPATYIYGFINGCWQTIEQKQTLSKNMWPDDIKAICGCALDAIRHAMPFHEAESRSPETQAKFDFITRGVLPQCIMEVEASIMLRNGEK